MDIIKIMDLFSENHEIIKLSNTLLFDLSQQNAEIADILHKQNYS